VFGSEDAMRSIVWIAGLAALAAAPASAQTMGGCGMSGANGTAMADPASADVGKAVRAFDEQQTATAAQSRRQREEALAYQENLRVRRRQAEQYAAAARSGVPLPADAAETLRKELEADIAQWRAEFRVSRGEEQAMRDRWLVARDSLAAEQWAQHRADWWTARDAWIAKNRP
jgi:hypothetical protein